MKSIIVLILIFGIIGLIQSKANREGIASSEFEDCDHDCLSCSHLDNDCQGDEDYRIEEYLDMEEDLESVDE